MAYDNLYLIKIFERIKKFSFNSRSLENSDMNWNYSGTGKTRIVSKVTLDKNEFYFFDSIFIENSYVKDNNLILKDRKLWCIDGNSIEFYHFRNGIYEKIFKKENYEEVLEKFHQLIKRIQFLNFYFQKINLY